MIREFLPFAVDFVNRPSPRDSVPDPPGFGEFANIARDNKAIISSAPSALMNSNPPGRSFSFEDKEGLMESAELSFDLVPGRDVARI